MTQPPQFAQKYRIKGNRLYETMAGKNGSFERLLCNFVPWITAEITLDDGAETIIWIRLRGIHESGRPLPEIEIPAAELAGFNWLSQRWGMDCILEVGKTGSRKSTLATLMLSFFGKFTASELPLSFRDTANSILYNAFSLKDVLTVIDDLHPSSRQEEQKMNGTAQAVMRAYPDHRGTDAQYFEEAVLDFHDPQPDRGGLGTGAAYLVADLSNIVDHKPVEDSTTKHFRPGRKRRTGPTMGGM